MSTTITPLYTELDVKREESSEDDETIAYRSSFRRDYARLIHSPSFRRLQGKTQLFPSNESDFFRNRLTHSIEVAQIAKTIANKLNNEHSYFKLHNIDTDLVEFAALAHDLGHPPFGHNGEKALDDCMKQYGGFEGNAQTLHILAKLEKKKTGDGNVDVWVDNHGKDQRLGLHLTYRSLASILKYDERINLRRKKSSGLAKGYYNSEAKLVERIREHVAPTRIKEKLKCIECYIMDIADDIAYSTYDLEDGLKGGFISPLSILSDIANNNGVLEQVTKKIKQNDPTISKKDVAEEIIKTFGDILSLESSVEELTKTFGGVLSLESSVDENKLKAYLTEKILNSYLTSSNLAENGYLRTEFTAQLVHEFVESVEVNFDETCPTLTEVKLSDKVRRKVEILKHFNFEIVTMSSRLKVVEYRGYEVIKTIFDSLDSEDGHLLLPPDYRLAYMLLTNTDERKRLICDFVAGMTDRYSIEFYSRIKGGGQTIFKPL